jgi:hypothetical protein
VSALATVLLAPGKRSGGGSIQVPPVILIADRVPAIHLGAAGCTLGVRSLAGVDPKLPVVRGGFKARS